MLPLHILVMIVLFGPSWQDLEVVVFRHHPGTIETRERTEARSQDEEVILKALKDGKIGYNYSGGLGSGYQLRLRARDLKAWKELVAGMHKSKSLTYYTEWQKDTKGYGLLFIGQ